MNGDEQFRAATSFAESTVGEDGAYLIPPSFSAEIDRVTFEESSLLALAGPTPIEGNTMSYPHTEATPWGTTGVQAYWEGEGETFTPSKPTYKKNMLTLHKLTALVNVTNEMLEDATAMSSEIPREMGARSIGKCRIRWLTVMVPACRLESWLLRQPCPRQKKHRKQRRPSTR